MPAPAGSDAGTASQLIPGVRRTQKGPRATVRRSGWQSMNAGELPYLLLKGDPARVGVPDISKTPAHGHGRPRIRCPRCAWQPGRDDLWMCTCLHSWNTFDTRGVCPACGRKWTQTQCQRCNQWSPHDDWYDDEPES